MMTLCFVVCSLSLALVSITMLARANDLRWRPGVKWNVRLLGFIASGVAPWGIIGYGWAHMWLMALIYLTLFIVGVTMVFVTTPYLPPWWRWIAGKDEAHDTN